MPGKHPDLAKLYHLNSSHVRRRVPRTDLDLDRTPLRFRTYPGSERWDLPGRDYDLAVALGDVLQRRRSVRAFRLQSLGLPLLGRLLHASYGLRSAHEMEARRSSDRSAPSAGALYPLELYVATQAVDGLPDGVYHYDTRAHQLELRRSGLVHAELASMTIGQEMIRESNVVVVMSAIFERTMWKYGQRGYRYIWLDAGHVGQNLCLCATALGLGAVAIGGFYDDEINALIRLPATEEEAIYLVCVGQPGEDAPMVDESL